MEKLKGTQAHQRYRLADGSIVPGVTTITGLLNKPALVRWANKLGLEGIDCTKYVDKTANVGTCAHLMIQAHLAGTKPDLSEFSPDTVDKAENGFLKFLTWESENPIDPKLLEAQLVSEVHQFGGTLDCVCARWQNRRNVSTLIDFKTGSGIYPEHVYQVAAYAKLAKENGHPVGAVSILRIGRDESEGFEERRVSGPELENGWRIFKHLLAIHGLTKKNGGGK